MLRVSVYTSCSKKIIGHGLAVLLLFFMHHRLCKSGWMPIETTSCNDDNTNAR